jgi:flagellar assembly factor FliW
MVALLDECAILNSILNQKDYELMKVILIGAIDKINALQKSTVNSKSPLTVNSKSQVAATSEVNQNPKKPYVFPRHDVAMSNGVARDNSES